MNFLKTVLATIVGLLIGFALMFFIFIGAISAIASMQDSTVEVKDNSLLVISMDEKIEDYSEKTRIKEMEFEDVNYNGLNSIVSAIKYAKDDEKIKGISIKDANGIEGYAQLKELRDAIEDFKKSNKFVYFYSNSPIITQKNYLLATVADSLFVGNGTDIAIQGMGANIRYYKELQDKTGIKMEVIRHGKYKSAVEPYLENTMSEANKEQIMQRITLMWQNYRDVVAKCRGISSEKVNEIADGLLGRTPQLALENKLIDAALFVDQYEEKLAKAMAVEKIEDVNTIEIVKYAEYAEGKIKEQTKAKDKIAVIYADGTIIDGTSPTKGLVGDKTIGKAFRKASDDKSVKAIILRINSPGGSADASENMHREIELAKKKKPVYVSMGNYAASGGYYIACNANRIFANKETITGSIGVFASLPNFSKFEKSIGIHNNQIGTNKFSTGYYRGYNPEAETTPEMIEMMTEKIENFYKTFIKRVSDGRKMPLERVDEIAQGRVWIGTDALKNGLVDEIGSFEDVVKYACKENKIENYRLVVYPEIEVSFKEYLTDIRPYFSLKEEIKKELGEDLYRELEKIKQMNFKGQEVQAKMPYEIEIY